MVIKLTQIQIEKIRKDFKTEIREIDKLKTSSSDKISATWKFLIGHEKGFET